jgi:hypothetical protein
MNIHIGCGTVYLENFINVDLPSPNCFLAHERPDLLEKFTTTEDEYYAKHANNSIDKFKAGPKVVETVCDRYGTFQNIPARDNSVKKILSRQVFEHQSVKEALLALEECRRVLLPGGRLTIDVPDTEASIRMYGQTQDPFYIRHIVGPISKGSWGHHIMSYSEPELVNLCESNGFIFLTQEENIHSYPAICLTFLRK